jgi:hypothetical protein
MALSYGDLNFSFQNNYTTEYILEDDNALYPEDHVQTYEFDTNNFNLTLNNGTTSDSTKSHLVDDNTGTFWTFTSVNDVLNITIDGNFTGAVDVDNNYAPFNRYNILGIINFLTCKINESSASLTVRIKNNTDSTWNTVLDNINVSTNSGIHDINEIVINENLDYIDLNDECHVEFVYNKNTTGDFDLELYEISLQSTMGFELDITDTDYVALEFDLRGESSRVNGFYAWIRTLNVSDAKDKSLNISLYKADGLLTRTASNLRTEGLIDPNYSLLIDNIIVPYLADNISYFEFNLGNTTDLSYYNYFIVIKSNATEGVYSLVTIPYNQYGDPEDATHATEHLLKTTVNDGSTWSNSVTSIGGGAYNTGQLDASSFKINITRGYMPSDFNGQFKIQDLELDDKDMTFSPFNDNDPDYIKEWGKATWIHDFTAAIPGNLNNDFQVNLTWDHNITMGVEFNVSYSVEAYKIETATSTYHIEYDGVPEWNLSYSFNPNLLNWNFSKFWYIYPNTMVPQNLYNITNDYSDLFTPAEISTFTEDSNYNIYNASYNLITGSSNGTFVLELTSFNCMNEMSSYINFNGNLLETRGFMYGDNISVKIGLQNKLGLATTGGNANVTLFQDGLAYRNLNSTTGVASTDENILYFNFGDQTILNVTDSDTLGSEYYLGYFWTNGTEIGCKKVQIYLESYDININDINYLSLADVNSLTGNTTGSLYDDYSLLIGSVNETTGTSRPEYYPINNDVSENFAYIIPSYGEEDPYDLRVSMLNFKKSENIFNPEETVNFKLQMQNLDDVIPFNVKIKFQLVSHANNEWVINETVSDPINFKPIGDNGNINEFDVSLKIPKKDTNTKIWEGFNSPIRLGGAKTIFTIYIEYDGQYHDVGSYTTSDDSLIVSQKENEFEGHILALETRENFYEGRFTQYFDRDVCLYTQSGSNSTFVINSYTRFYSSSYNQSIKSFPLKLNSKFESITTDPEDIYGEFFDISSILMTEFGTIITDKEVTCQYKNGSTWENISSQITDINGITNFAINTTIIDVGNNFFLRLLWSGNSTITNCSQEIPINKVVHSNDIDFTFSMAISIIYKNSYNFLTFQLYNNGTSTMEINVNTISIDVTGSLTTTFYYNSIEMEHLNPGETTNLNFEIYCGDVSFNQINFSFSIEAQNKLTKETTIFKSSMISLEVIEPPFIESLSWIISILIISIFIAIFVISVLYARSTRNKIKRSLEKSVQQKRPQRGRYVKVSEIKPEIKESKKKPIETMKEEASEIEKTSKKTTDLDSLLEEKGLKEKTRGKQKKSKSSQPKKDQAKTPKSVDPFREKLNKMNLTRLKEYCNDRNIKISSDDTKSQIIQKILKTFKKKK